MCAHARVGVHECAFNPLDPIVLFDSIVGFCKGKSRLKSLCVVTDTFRGQDCFP